MVRVAFGAAPRLTRWSKAGTTPLSLFDVQPSPYPTTHIAAAAVHEWELDRLKRSFFKFGSALPPSPSPHVPAPVRPRPPENRPILTRSWASQTSQIRHVSTAVQTDRMPPSGPTCYCEPATIASIRTIPNPVDFTARRIVVEECGPGSKGLTMTEEVDVSGFTYTVHDVEDDSVFTGLLGVGDRLLAVNGEEDWQQNDPLELIRLADSYISLLVEPLNSHIPLPSPMNVFPPESQDFPPPSAPSTVNLIKPPTPDMCQARSLFSPPNRPSTTIADNCEDEEDYTLGLYLRQYETAV